jgi:hypothetical protein
MFEQSLNKVLQAMPCTQPGFGYGINHNQSEPESRFNGSGT